MEISKEELYKAYQKKSDQQVIDAYFTGIKNSKILGLNQDLVLEATNQFKAAKQVIEERNLNLDYYKRQQALKDQKENNKTNFDDYIKNGFKSLALGLLIFGITLVLIYKFEGYNFLFFGLILGGFKILQGIIELSVGLYIRVAHAKKF